MPKKCPVCQTECDDADEFCQNQICSWKFIYLISDSTSENQAYMSKLLAAKADYLDKNLNIRKDADSISSLDFRASAGVNNSDYGSINNGKRNEINLKSATRKKLRYLIYFLLILFPIIMVILKYSFREELNRAVFEVSEDNINNLAEMDKKINGLQNQISVLQGQIATINAEMTAKDNHFTQTLADFSKLHDERLDTTRKEMEASITAIQRQSKIK